MMIYYFSEENKSGVNAGSKARNDVEKILHNKNYKPLQIYLQRSSKNVVRNIINISKRLLQISPMDRVLIQYPMPGGYNRLLPFIASLRKTIIIIHDLDTLRGIRSYNEVKAFRSCEYIISHNEAMTDYLINSGIENNRIINLDIFDYLTNGEHMKRESSELFCFAGNLRKSLFIYSLPKFFYEAGINIYGDGYEQNHKIKGIKYRGSFDSEIIHKELCGRYGIIWDGDSSETCSGLYGQYMRYNNPHKLSMYIASGIPVITWSKAAIADFVQKNNIGLTVSSLYEVGDTIKNVTESRYKMMVENVMQIQKKIISGHYLKKQLSIVEKKINCENL